MRKKVAVQHVTMGMYVAGLDCPWIDAPFEMPFQLQGFPIRTLEELQQVQRLCQHVYIDPRLGKDASRYTLEEDESGDLVNGLPGISPTNRLETVYQDQATVEEELVTATEVLRDTKQVYSKVMSDVRADRNVDVVPLKKTVGHMVESVIRNPDALSWLVKLKYRDEYTYSHSIATCVLGLVFGRHLGLPMEELDTLGFAILLQDIGKLTLPKNLLEKPAALTPVENKAIKKHVQYSIDILIKQCNAPYGVIEVVYLHHERYNGNGYPCGRKGGEIGLLGAIAGIVDSYDAMTSERPYSTAETSFCALSELYESSNNAFSGAIIEHFIHCIGIFSIGSFVKLNTGDIGVIVSRNRVWQLKPKVMLIMDGNGQRPAESKTIDLAGPETASASEPLRIAEVIDPKKFNINPMEYFA